MGGVNHQPCNKFIERSTETSRSLSVALANLWLSNVSFEDAILASIRKDAPNMQHAINVMDAAIGAITKFDADLVALIADLEVKTFQPLPTTDMVLDQIAAAFASQEALRFTETAVATVNDHIASQGNFTALFNHYRARAAAIKTNMELVHADFVTLQRDHITDLANACEENRTTVRITFCRTVVLLNELLAEFCYSSLASATMWNMNQGHPTMVQLETANDDFLFAEIPREAVVA